MDILIGITVLLVCQLIGENFVMWIALPVPGLVLGMLLLLMLLRCGAKPDHPLETTASVL